MRCGIDCMNYLLDYYEFDELSKKTVIDEMNACLSDKGISIYDFICIANRNHLLCRAIRSVWIPKKNPCILYFKRRKHDGHFLILVKRERFHFIVYDPLVQYRKINKLWLYLFWSHICILCYN